LVSEFAVSLTVALTVVATLCVAGFGFAVAEEENVGGARGVAETGLELGLLPAEFEPATT
jgi:hypothetical protein